MKRHNATCFFLALGLVLIIVFPVRAQYWRLAGNSDATSSSKFGTTNKIPLRIFTNNTERMRLDTQGRFGIGTTSPAFTLDVANFNLTQVARFNGPTGKMFIGLWKTNGLRGYVGSNQPNTYDMDFGTSSNNSSGAVHLVIKGAPKLSIASNGNTGIGTIAPAKLLELRNGDMRLSTTVANTPYYLEFLKSDSRIDWRFEHSISGRYIYMSYSRDNFSTFADGVMIDTATTNYGNKMSVYGKLFAYVYVTPSDRKLKDNIASIDRASELIAKLKPQTYYYKANELKGLNLPVSRQYGFIAQELEEVVPEMVSNTEYRVNDGLATKTESIKSVNYLMLIPILTKGMQEQQETINSQQETINNLKNEVSELKEMVRKIAGGQTINSPANMNALGQNNPNPVKNSTIISYSLEKPNSRAQLIVVDKSGKALRTINLSGSGNLNLDASNLASGIYTYSLLVDGRHVESRQMIVTR